MRGHLQEPRVRLADVVGQLRVHLVKRSPPLCLHVGDVEVEHVGKGRGARARVPSCP